nr:LicD family protein [Ohessyouella blattaphilus]
MRKLQLIELEIIKLFVEICEKYNLRYYLVGGSMLGAVRHKGFIPWDDDTDVGMPRPDYEKFLDIVENELPNDYGFLNYKRHKEYKRYFSRIVNMKVKIHNGSNTKAIVENVWLDIFPFDGMPANPVRRQLHFWHLTVNRFFYHASCFEELVNLNRPGRAWYLQVAIKVLSVIRIGRNLDTKKILLKIEKGLMKYSYDDSSYMVSFFGAYLAREIIDKRILGQGAKYQFEDLVLNGPERYDEFLTHFYGDYMKQPKDTLKDKHNIMRIEYEQ